MRHLGRDASAWSLRRACGMRQDDGPGMCEEHGRQHEIGLRNICGCMPRVSVCQGKACMCLHLCGQEREAKLYVFVRVGVFLSDYSLFVFLCSLLQCGRLAAQHLKMNSVKVNDVNSCVADCTQ